MKCPVWWPDIELILAAIRQNRSDIKHLSSSVPLLVAISYVQPNRWDVLLQTDKSPLNQNSFDKITAALKKSVDWVGNPQGDGPQSQRGKLSYLRDLCCRLYEGKLRIWTSSPLTANRGGSPTQVQCIEADSRGIDPTPSKPTFPKGVQPSGTWYWLTFPIS